MMKGEGYDGSLPQLVSQRPCVVLFTGSWVYTAIAYGVGYPPIPVHKVFKSLSVMFVGNITPRDLRVRLLVSELKRRVKILNPTSKWLKRYPEKKVLEVFGKYIWMSCSSKYLTG
ncbi:UNVERIFIED_CONTAM: hypothetical protein K2H54_048558 [Gekko kuhli]